MKKQEDWGKPLRARGYWDSVLNPGISAWPFGQQFPWAIPKIAAGKFSGIAGDWAEDEAVPPNDWSWIDYDLYIAHTG
ncbi:MAG: hypothetical protein CM1200mP14_28990 [Gammaproteobacteria bacterium]|nr:MAG: hypothetical protein CM1200mP14_28990 [Gammaproteobacteria bacterium]